MINIKAKEIEIGDKVYPSRNPDYSVIITRIEPHGMALNLYFIHSVTKQEVFYQKKLNTILPVEKHAS